MFYAQQSTRPRQHNPWAEHLSGSRADATGDPCDAMLRMHGSTTAAKAWMLPLTLHHIQQGHSARQLDMKLLFLATLASKQHQAADRQPLQQHTVNTVAPPTVLGTRVLVTGGSHQRDAVPPPAHTRRASCCLFRSRPRIAVAQAPFRSGSQRRGAGCASAKETPRVSTEAAAASEKLAAAPPRSPPYPDPDAATWLAMRSGHTRRANVGSGLSFGRPCGQFAKEHSRMGGI